MKTGLFLVLRVAFVMIGLGASAAYAQCTSINAVPFTITQPGAYCVSSSLSANLANGYAITVQASDVVIDFGGNTLDNTASAANVAYGVATSGVQHNITIRNGTIRGFGTGINLSGVQNFAAQNLLVEKMVLDGNLLNGIVLGGVNCVVRDNWVVGTGGYTGATPQITNGIFVGGTGVRVEHNTVSGLTPMPGQNAYGIVLGINGASASSDAVMVDNRVSNPTTLAGTTGISVQGNIFKPSSAVLERNAVMGMSNGITFVNASGKYRDTTTVNVTTPYTGGTSAGGNF